MENVIFKRLRFVVMRYALQNKQIVIYHVWNRFCVEKKKKVFKKK